MAKGVYFKNIENGFLKIVIIMSAVIAVLLLVAFVALITLPVVAIASVIGVISVGVALFAAVCLVPVAIVFQKKQNRE